jgi:glycosyltransferase involved in cell wall biosynthesis
MALRIVQISTSDLQGGAEKTAWKLHQRFREKGHWSRLVVGRKLSADPDVVQIAPLRGRGPRGWMNRQREFRLGRQYVDHPGSHRIPEIVGEPWDVTHAHNLHGGYFDLAALRRLTKLAPTILTLHDMWLLTGHCAHPFSSDRWRVGCGSCPDLTIYPAIPRDSTRANLQRKRRLLRSAEFAIASPADWLLDRVAESYLDEKPRRHVPNPVDVNVFTPGDPAEARASLGLPLDRPIVLLPVWNASKSRFKDAPTFVKSIRALADLCPLGITFGDEERTSNSVRVVQTSFDESRIAAYYRAADVVAVASRAETSPLTILEGFATARPVVATNVGGIPELVQDGRSALLVEPGDAGAFATALRNILESEELARRLGATGLEQARSRHALERVADMWLDWYAELAEEFRLREDRAAARGRFRPTSRPRARVDEQR